MYTGKIFGISLVTSFIVSVVVCSFFFLILPRLEGQSFSFGAGGKIEVPTVTNMPVDEARLVLQNKGFLMMEFEKKKDPNVPVGFVISQDPLPGFKLDKGALVKVVTSGGGAEVIIPNLEGIPQGQARLQLESIDLVVGSITRDMHESIPRDAVISTDPPGGARAPTGTVVNIKISSGVSLVTVPSVFKMGPAGARSRLEKLGLKVNTKYTTNIDYEFGVVVGQDPRSGKEVKKGSTVTIIVNAEAR